MGVVIFSPKVIRNQWDSTHKEENQVFGLLKVNIHVRFMIVKPHLHLFDQNIVFQIGRIFHII